MSKKYDLEERAFLFAKAVIEYINKLKKTLANVEVSRQLIRSSGSTGANYIEANESLSRKDFVYRIKLCRKEAKESTFWLKLLEDKEGNDEERQNLIQESVELTKIFGAILRKSV
ncbi:MAG TPA: four helix bundle protein [Balneolaceae bacterium]|nr:four helix bundle protein [Balneolaceae bacterium]